jgi:hypothetical protein
VALALRVATPARAAAPKKQLFAIVVGSNRALDPAQTLNFADDDAVKNEEVLAMLGADTVLLVSPDGQTRDRYRNVLDRPDGGAGLLTGPGAALSRARPATHDNLVAAIRETFDKIRAAKAAGVETELFFWFSGHGIRRDTASVLLLEEGEFSRTDLFETLIKVSPAGFNHLFIDACSAASFVSSRGDEGTEADERQHELIEAMVDDQSIWRFKNVGVFFAATSKGRALEWRHYQGGVLSFQLRSALLDAADANGDKRVTYLEAFAFIKAANHEVKGPDAHMEISSRLRDDELHRTLADWTGVAATNAVQLGEGHARHLRFADEQGVPLLETNKDVADTPWIALQPRDVYELKLLFEKEGKKVDWTRPFPSSPGVVELEPWLAKQAPPDVTDRGDADLDAQLLAGLFQTRYGLGFYNGIMSMAKGSDVLTPRRKAPRQPPGTLRPLTIATLSVAAAAGAAAWLFRRQSNESYGQYLNAAPADEARWKSSTQRWDWATTTALVGAGVAAAAGGTMLLFDLRRGSGGEPEGTSVALGVSGRF